MLTLIAAIIILALIFYAIKDLLSDKDSSAWTNIAITALILFTVILSIFMVLNRKSSLLDDKNKQPVQEQTTKEGEEETPAAEPATEPEMTTKQAMEAIAEEYVYIEDDCKKNPPKTGSCADTTAEYIKKRYSLSSEDWQSFLEIAAKEDLFNNARKMKKEAVENAKEKTTKEPVATKPATSPVANVTPL